MIYRYVKAPPGYTLKKPRSARDQLRLSLSLVFMVIGVAISTTVAYPLISYQLVYAPSLQRGGLVSPLARPAISEVKASDTSPTFVSEVINTSLDYTDATSWFPTQQKSAYPKSSSVYTLSIDKLGIDRAVVRSDNTDLKESLIHYPGTAEPGDLGNPVIFGHSVLPQFFNPQNYHTIFSTLHTLTIGDTLEISAEGATYTYKIFDMYETDPDDLSPLAQTYSGRYITLITCTPPGTYLRRLIIKAQII